MKVVDTKDHTWFLFEHEGDLYLDTNCTNSAIGYSYMIRLNEAERELYRMGAREYLSKLASEVEYSVPILADSTSIYKSRRVSYEISNLTLDAVRVWRETSHIQKDREDIADGGAAI